MRIKRLTLTLCLVGLGWALSACGTRELSFADRIQLGKNSLQFDQTGAQLTECTLVTQIERGRSSATSGGGAG